MFFDPVYFLFLAPAMLLAAYAQWKLQSTFAEASQIPAASGYTGAQTAEHLLHSGGIYNVSVEFVPGELSDHYSPQEKALRLSEPVYQERSLAALGVAAHEAGHAFQDAERDSMLVLRNAIVPLANFGGSISWILLVAGMVLASAKLVYIGIGAFSLTVLFQVINLPVEYDASARARKKLLEAGLITPEEDVEVGKVLNAAALTYVAGTLSSIATLLYFLFRAGFFNGGSNRE
ncbi:zinc metallopeptidase [Tuwongella immobilis]|uniref:Zinc metallopeptidase n=1 Tax=Tuwongella immobilis TaxID=692036 RepID=A0A6C2YST8_9BACT|nr:zinc metallopeptidase [Tuwongella immobilis]VIP04441.1 Zn-dependent protease OS=Rhodopirellula sallentina SM41 GN=RSSM_03340 PE=4 SV=1: Zn_peptidase_2 [Tuwongella immobilis]VTS06244.1 Zn-dependent protease OS=Rhodopirellula sallentina SM41 GN=RSSM_03340 PE=4 SV=1: Zn_peptidase_2 [Tuwongella immobilis]